MVKKDLVEPVIRPEVFGIILLAGFHGVLILMQQPDNLCLLIRLGGQSQCLTGQHHNEMVELLGILLVKVDELGAGIGQLPDQAILIELIDGVPDGGGRYTEPGLEFPVDQPVPQGDLSGDNIMDQHIIDLFAQGSALEKFAHNSLASLLLW